LGGAGQQETLLQRQRQLLGEALSHKPLDYHLVPGSVPPERDSARSTTLAVVTTSSVTDALDGDSTGADMVFLVDMELWNVKACREFR
jgi:hypothetical protein